MAEVLTNSFLTGESMAGLKAGAPTPQALTAHEASLERVGNYAVKPLFSDGHESGIFTWDYLYELGQQQDALWAQYTARLAAAGTDRDTPMAPKGAAGGHGCGSH